MKTRQEQIAELEAQWKSDPRWIDVKRNYTAEDVVRLRGSVQPEYTYARNGAEKLWKLVRGDARKGLRQLHGRDYRWSGDATGKSRYRGGLFIWLAGCGRWQYL